MNAANAQIGEWLGIQPPATETEILRIVEGKLAPAVIKRLIALGLERGEIDAVIIPQRTLQHRRSRREKLTVEESDRGSPIIPWRSRRTRRMARILQADCGRRRLGG